MPVPPTHPTSFSGVFRGSQAPQIFCGWWLGNQRPILLNRCLTFSCVTGLTEHSRVRGVCLCLATPLGVCSLYRFSAVACSLHFFSTFFGKVLQIQFARQENECVSKSWAKVKRCDTFLGILNNLKSVKWQNLLSKCLREYF